MTTAKSTEHMAKIIGQVGEGVAVATFDGTITYVNDAWAEMHESSREELIGLNLSVFHSKRQMVEDVIPFNERVRRFGRHQGRVGHITRSGREFETLMTTTILRNEDGEPVEMVAVARDVTEDIRARHALETRGRYLSCLAEISTRIIESEDVLGALPEVLRLLGEAAEVSRTYIFENSKGEHGELECSQFAYWTRDSTPSGPVPISRLKKLPYVAKGLKRWVEVLGSGRILAGDLGDLPESEQARLESYSIKSILLIPLFVSEYWFGYIGFDCCMTARTWSDEEIALLRVAAAHIARAIENHALLEELLFDANELEKSNRELKEAYEETLEGWARVLELRDRDTEGHTRRVADLSQLVGRKLGLDEESLTHLFRGALLHDIGKMAIPDNILKKAGPLTKEEWDVMKTHPALAREMLSRISYLEPALDIPHRHHERWNGSGYPGGLKAEDIPLAARIFAVVDVWDALHVDRPNRKAWPEEKIIAYIRERSGTDFDPAAVESFFSVLNLE